MQVCTVGLSLSLSLPVCVCVCARARVRWISHPVTHHMTSLSRSLPQELEVLQATLAALTDENAKLARQHTAEIAALQHACIPRAHLLPVLNTAVCLLRECAADMTAQRELAHVIIDTHQQAEEEMQAARHEMVMHTNAHATEIQALREDLAAVEAALSQQTTATDKATADASAETQSCTRFQGGLQRLRETNLNARAAARKMGTRSSVLEAWLTGTRRTCEKVSRCPDSCVPALTRTHRMSVCHLRESARAREREEDRRPQEAADCWELLAVSKVKRRRSRLVRIVCQRRRLDAVVQVWGLWKEVARSELRARQRLAKAMRVHLSRSLGAAFKVRQRA